jgi:hypothetical protein
VVVVSVAVSEPPGHRVGSRRDQIPNNNQARSVSSNRPFRQLLSRQQYS